MSYPTLPTDLSDASERFLLTSADREVVGRCRNDPQRLGLAVLLKVYQAVGYVPSKGMIPRGIVQRVADQIDVSPTQFRRLITGRWRQLVLQVGPEGTRAMKHAFEVCVLDLDRPSILAEAS